MKLSPAFRISLFYVLFGVIWALLSEIVPAIFITNSAQRAMFEAYDQIVLVIISIFVLYNLIHWEEKMREKSELEVTKLARVVQQTADHVLIASKNGAIEYVNPAFEKLTGYSAREVIGKNPRILKSGQMSPSFYENLWSTILAGRVFKAEITNKKKDGSLFYEEKSITPIRDSQGNITHFVSTGKDISERKQAEEELKKADQMKGEFMSMVSHELRTPLTAIKGFVQLLDQETYGNLSPVQKDFVAKIKTQSNHLDNLIISILDFTRLESGQRFDIQKEPVSLVNEIDEVVEGMRPDFEKKEIKLNIDIPPDFPTIISDEAKIERILTNLLGNAFKFTPRRGTVTINAKVVGEKVFIVISDTGIGVAKENQEKIFERFYQVDSTITRGYGGIGMGLTIAKEIVEALGGKIWAESVGEGKGSSFIFTLPVK